MPFVWMQVFSFTCEQRNRNPFIAITRLLKTKSTSETKVMYNRHQSIKSIKSITQITVTARRAVKRLSK